MNTMFTVHMLMDIDSNESLDMTMSVSYLQLDEGRPRPWLRSVANLQCEEMQCIPHIKQ